MINGWYIVTYGLGIYILNLGIGFLSPAADPATDGTGTSGANLKCPCKCCLGCEHAPALDVLTQH
jgi:hypothetical protein